MYFYCNRKKALSVTDSLSKENAYPITEINANNNTSLLWYSLYNLTFYSTVEFSLHFQRSNPRNNVLLIASIICQMTVPNQAN